MFCISFYRNRAQILIFPKFESIASVPMRFVYVLPFSASSSISHCSSSSFEFSGIATRFVVKKRIKETAKCWRSTVHGRCERVNEKPPSLQVNGQATTDSPLDQVHSIVTCAPTLSWNTSRLHALSIVAQWAVTEERLKLFLFNWCVSVLCRIAWNNFQLQQKCLFS